MYVANDDPHFAPSPQILEKFATLLWSGKDEIIEVFFFYWKGKGGQLDIAQKSGEHRVHLSLFKILRKPRGICELEGEI